MEGTDYEQKLAKVVLLPSVLGDDDAGMECEKLQLEENSSSTEGAESEPKDDSPVSKEEANNEQGKPGSPESMSSDEDYNTDLELEDEEDSFDPTGQRSYKEACQIQQVVPSSYVLQNMQNMELNMMHRGLGPKGTKALAVPMGTNTSVLRLNLRDNWMEGLGGAAIAKMLKENCYITEVDLSDNNLGDGGAKAIASMLKENHTLLSLSLSGNHFTDQSSEPLAQALLTNTRLQHLDLSHNKLGELAGKNLGEALSENSGLRSISLAWNCFRGRGAVMLSTGIGGNVFLQSVNMSFNGFGKEGAAALGLVLKENNILEDLNVSNNRIPPEGAIYLATGLKVNKTLKSLNVGKNPIQNGGCFRILKAVHENPSSALESFNCSDIPINQDFEDLYTRVKENFPLLRREQKNMAMTGSCWAKGHVLYRYSVSPVTRRFSARVNNGWLRSMFVHKADARKDAHSNLLSKKETNHLYKIQFHNVKPDCLEVYNDLQVEVQKKLSQDAEYPCEIVGSWNTWYGEQDQAVHLWRYRGGYPALTECLQKLKTNEEYKEFRKERSKMLISRRNQLLLEFSFWNEPLPRKGPNIYEMRTYNLKPGTMIEWGNHWARAISYRQENKEAVSGFFSQIGDLYVVHHLWAYESLQAREETRNSAWMKEGWDVNVFYTVPLIRSMESRIMIPTGGSPLQ